ncbi:hypothetical protein A2310_05090 [candidate division WOR-1 bacterium RIFOXYB2_FULL_37_13]|uniref:Bacterial Ig domain-containing protein n=1 Tax=candidate division WOR-1 bacterium RIFOXYB2_FULL_37_13 TaxID=1802579 RepID=A0A1F4SUI6_UNCSA|nr:MAG: hypothetical protein A2310_05090 [candidate division WOR-1 bacterium RIFOXYB2_FULL_37_13]
MKFIKSLIVVLMIGLFVKGSFAFQLGNQVELSTEAESLTEFLLNKEKLDNSLEDGIYNYTSYSIDEAGNISNNITGQIKVDTTSPAVLSLEALPSPFTPNDDGVNDSTKILYKLSEPAYVTTNIYRDDGALYKTYKALTNDFQYPHLESSNPGSLETFWEWDGKGGRGELIGGKFTYEVIAEDNVGNLISSETKEIVVDRATSLIPYCYAEPDPFSAVREKGNHTDIKYYVSRDNVLVTIEVLGKEDKPIKILALGELQNKGDHSVSWDGDFQEDYTGSVCPKDKTKVCDSAYQFRITAYDSYNRDNCLNSNTVYVDNTAPYITIYPVEVNYVSREARLKYNIPENSTVNAALYDENGILLQNFISDEVKTAGEYYLTWDMKNKPSEKVYFKVSARDSAKNSDEKKTEAFSVEPESVLTIADFVTTPNPFTPNGDAIDDQVRISYKLLGGVPDYKVTIEILNGAGVTVQELTRDEVEGAGSYSINWDGLLSEQFAVNSVQKKILEDGRYYVNIMVQDKLGNKVSGQKEILLVATRPDVSIDTNYEIFSPNGDGIKDEIQFNYSILYNQAYVDGQALVKLEVLNSSMESVWGKTFSHTPGNYSYLWDGSPLLLGEGLGVRLSAGQYYVKISATDSLQTSAIAKTAGFTCDYSNPNLEIISVEPNPFSPYVNGKKDQTVISYTLAKQAYVTVTVKKDGETIKILQDNKLTEAYVPIVSASSKKIKAKGIPTLTWDGKDSEQFTINSGQYDIAISAMDLAGNTYEVSQPVTVDNATPEAPSIDVIASWTNKSSQEISGSAEATSSVEVYLNDVLVKTVSANGLNRYSTFVTLGLGENKIKTRCEDRAGNVSGFSSITEVFYETDAPIITNISVSPNPATVGTLEISFTVSETLEADPVVKINGNPAIRTSEQFTVNSVQYEYIYNITTSDVQGNTVVSIEAVDLAKNKIVYTNNKLLTIDTISPEKPILNNLPNYTNKQAQEIVGTAEAGCKIFVYNDSKLFSSAEVLSIGIFKSTIPLNRGDNAITVLSQDSAGNISAISDAENIIYDPDSPAVYGIEVSPAIATVGTIEIKFAVSETLKSNPVVTINGNPAIRNRTSASEQNSVQYEYSYNIAADEQQGSAGIAIKVTDLAGNSTTYNSDDLLVIDCIAPIAPVVNDLPEHTNVGSQVIAGNAEANASIYIYNNNLLVGSTETLVNGTFNKTIALDIGNNEIKVKAKDAAGNISQFSNVQTVVYDITSPEISTVSIDPSLSSIGQVTISFTVSETLESDPVVTINGNRAGKISEQKQSEQFTVYSVQYEYSYNIAADEQQGSAGIAIKVIDLAGNSTTYSSDDLLIIDCIAPVVPVVNDLPDYTNVGLQVITGTAEANASIYIYNNNLLVGSTETSSGGTFSKTIALDIGNNEIKVKAKDAAGNISQLSDGQTIVYDIEEPRLSFIEVSPSLSTIGSVLIGFTVSEPLISDPVVDINGNLAVRQSMENQISGIRYYYTYEVTKADQEGAATISIKAGDMAGNLTTYSSDKFLTIDFSSPDAPSIAVLPNYTNINTYTISGEAEPNTQISIYNNNVLVATINCENDGTFSVTITLNIGKNEIKITAEDSAGNMSELSSTQTIVYDIETPKISEISVNPSLSSLGFVLIEFTVSEKLMSDPSVKVNDSVADKIIGIQNAGGASWSYQYACNIDSSEQQGSATISIKTTDLADNSTTYSSDDLLVIDCVSSIAPVVNDLPDIRMLDHR